MADDFIPKIAVAFCGSPSRPSTDEQCRIPALKSTMFKLKLKRFAIADRSVGKECWDSAEDISKLDTARLKPVLKARLIGIR